MTQKFVVIHVWPDNSAATVMPDYHDTYAAAAQSAVDYSKLRHHIAGHLYFAAVLPDVEAVSSDEPTCGIKAHINDLEAL